MPRSILGVRHSSIVPERWTAALPSVEEARPCRCPRCGVASQEPGRPLQLVGHGVVSRCIWGPADLKETPGTFQTVLLRRYRCLSCKTVVRVGPALIERRAMYSTLAIALALALWVIEGWTASEVRSLVSPFSVRGVSAPSKWASLKRWSHWLLQGRLWMRPGPVWGSLRESVLLHLRAVLPAELLPVCAVPVVKAVLEFRTLEAIG